MILFKIFLSLRKLCTFNFFLAFNNNKLKNNFYIKVPFIECLENNIIFCLLLKKNQN